MIGEDAAGNIDQDFAKLRRFDEMAAGGYSLDQRPARIFVEGGDGFGVSIQWFTHRESPLIQARFSRRITVTPGIREIYGSQRRGRSIH
jgi:hypothetical protein